MFRQAPGVWVTAAGFAGGFMKNPTYQESCTGHTGRANAVPVVFDPKIVSCSDLLTLFWENHDPAPG
jgi:peptide-methionine (S)-S-oxide reductase